MTTMVKDRDYSTRENNQLDGFTRDNDASQHSPGRYCAATMTGWKREGIAMQHYLLLHIIEGGGQPSHSIGAYRFNKKKTDIFIGIPMNISQIANNAVLMRVLAKHGFPQR